MWLPQPQVPRAACQVGHGSTRLPVEPVAGPWDRGRPVGCGQFQLSLPRRQELRAACQATHNSQAGGQGVTLGSAYAPGSQSRFSSDSSHGGIHQGLPGVRCFDNRVSRLTASSQGGKSLRYRRRGKRPRVVKGLPREGQNQSSPPAAGGSQPPATGRCHSKFAYCSVV